jgi:hypothetical protein
MPTAVAHAAVAVDALQVVFADASAAGDQFVDKSLMTSDASVLQNAGIARLDPNGLMEIHESETLRVPKAIVRLGQILRHEIVW